MISMEVITNLMYNTRDGYPGGLLYVIAAINHSLITLSYEEYTTSQIQTHSDHCSDRGIHSFQGTEQSDIEYLSEDI